jgi:DNA-binding response OmpR family regulator
MKTPPRILIADDNPENLDIFQRRLAVQGYEILMATDGEEALAIARAQQPDLILLDVMMPKMDGIEACRHLKADPSLPFVPIIMVTAKTGSQDVVAGLDAGADEYLPKPVDHAALVARVKSMLRIKALHDEVQEQSAQVEAQSVQLAEWNRTLEQRVQEQLAQIDSLGRLKRFFSPQLAEMIVAGGVEDPLKTHRREVTVVFLDLRGFTAFAEISEPEEVMGVLREYHTEMGKLILAYEGTLERFTGDGMMIFFNDPVPMTDPEERAIRMALAMRDRVDRRHRLRGTLGLRSNRHRHQPRRPSLWRGQARPDSDLKAPAGKGGGVDRGGARGRADLEGLSPPRHHLQRPACESVKARLAFFPLLRWNNWGLR